MSCFFVVRRFRLATQWSAMAVLIAGFGLAGKADITHRYSFNDGTANDSIGSANGVLVNGASVSGGKLVLANDGVQTNASIGQYVSLPVNILHTRNFTLETWFTYGGGHPWQRIIDLGNSVPDPTYGMIGQGFLILTFNGMQTLGQFSLNSWGGYPTDFVFGPPMPVGGQHFLAYVYYLDTQQEMLYLDGKFASTGPASIDPSTASFTNFWLGRSQFSQDPLYNGSLDELRTYDRALTGAEILAAYNAGPNVLVVPQPATLAAQTVGTNVVLSWSSNISGNLQSTTNLSNASGWADVTNRITVVGSNSTVTVTDLMPQQFFRLNQ
jgi:hypothetical protein